MSKIISAEARITSSADLRAFDAVGKKIDQIAKASKSVDQTLSKFGAGTRSVDAFGRSFSAISTASRHVDTIGNNFVMLERKVNRAERAMRAFGKTSGAILAAGGSVAAASGLLTGYGAAQVGKKAVNSAADFDIGVRRQRAYAGITEQQQAPLIAQAKRIGQDTQFSNLDIVEAQTAVMQRLPDNGARAEVARGITEEVKNYALAMRADMKTSSEAITSFLTSTGKDISTQGAALKNARNVTNMLIRMAKLGGMSDDDIQGFTKFGAATGSLAGLSDQTMAALGIGLKRAGFRGEEAGVALRTIGSKLVSPTSKGLDALTAAGINYNDFTKMPGGLSIDNLESFSKRRFGKGLSTDQRARLNGVLEDGDVVGNRDEFVRQVSEIVAEGFDKKANGQTKAQDAQKIAKMVGDFYKLSTESVDTEGLLKAILSNPSMSVALLNAFFTDKHGGKAGALAKVFDQFGKDREQLGQVPDDYGNKISAEIMGGLGGSFERLKGSVENLILAMGEAQAERLKAAFDRIGDTLDAISNMSPAAMRFTTEVGAAAAALVAFAGAAKAAQMISGGSSAASAAIGGAAAGGAAAAGKGMKVLSGLRGGAWLAAAIAAYEFGPDLVGSATGTDRDAPGDAFQRAYMANHPTDTVGRLRRERDNKRWLRGPEVSPTMTYGTGVSAELTGSAEVTGQVTGKFEVVPGSELLRLVESMKQMQISVKGSFNANGAGSTGVSAPDAAAPALRK